MNPLFIRVVAGCALVLAAGMPLHGLAITNQEFSSQVRSLRAQMARDEQVVEGAAMLCAYLPPHRAMDEPQCVALRGHLNATALNGPTGGKSPLGQWLDYLSRVL